MRWLVLFFLTGCVSPSLSVEPVALWDTEDVAPGVRLDVTVEGTDVLWVNATISNDGDETYTLTGTPPGGCAPSFQFTVSRDDEVIDRHPEFVCELYGERALAPGDEESMGYQWDLQPGLHNLGVTIDVLSGEPWQEHAQAFTLAIDHDFIVQ